MDLHLVLHLRREIGFPTPSRFRRMCLAVLFSHVFASFYSVVGDFAASTTIFQSTELPEVGLLLQLGH